MKIQEIIEKAIEGGWKNKIKQATPILSRRFGLKIAQEMYFMWVFSDPNFWKALHPTLNLTRMDNEGHMTEPWKNLAKSFWDFIMDGGTAEEFFKELK